MAFSTLAISGAIALAAGTAAISAHWFTPTPSASTQVAVDAQFPACDVDPFQLAMSNASLPPASSSNVLCNLSAQRASLQTASLTAVDSAFPR